MHRRSFHFCPAIPRLLDIKMPKRSTFKHAFGWTYRCYKKLRRVAGVLIVVVLGVRLSITDVAQSDGITLSTPLRQRSHLAFSDGSILDVNAGTVMLLKDGPRRQILLEEGEIHAVIKHGVSKPIDVFVGNLALVDFGTALNVSVHDRVTAVSVTDGAVLVEEVRPDGSLAEPVDVTGSSHQRRRMLLGRGDLIRLDQRDGTVFADVSRNNFTEADLRSSWTTGELITSGERLDQAIQEFNRYNHMQIVINDPAIARMVVGGHYYLTDVDGFLSDLRLLGVETVPILDTHQQVVQMSLLRAPANGSTCPEPPPPPSQSPSAKRR